MTLVHWPRTCRCVRRVAAILGAFSQASKSQKNAMFNCSYPADPCSHVAIRLKLRCFVLNSWPNLSNIQTLSNQTGLHQTDRTNTCFILVWLLAPGAQPINKTNVDWNVKPNKIKPKCLLCLCRASGGSNQMVCEFFSIWFAGLCWLRILPSLLYGIDFIFLIFVVFFNVFQSCQPCCKYAEIRNVLLDCEGHVKLTDFGFAKVRAETSSSWFFFFWGGEYNKNNFVPDGTYCTGWIWKIWDGSGCSIRSMPHYALQSQGGWREDLDTLWHPRVTLLFVEKNKGQQTHLNFTAFSEEAETEGILNSNSTDGTCFGVGVIAAPAMLPLVLLLQVEFW